MPKTDKKGRQSSKIEFKYIFQDDYNPIYVNGAYGGISPNKELIVHFYLERVGLPDSQTHSLEESGKIGKEIAREPLKEHPFFIRVVENGIILSLKGARGIHKWLGEKIKELEKIEDLDESDDK